MKKKLLIISSLLLISTTIVILTKKKNTDNVVKVERIKIKPTQKGRKKTLEERALYDEARNLYEFQRQVNPISGIIPAAEKKLEFENASNSKLSKSSTSKTPETTYIDRGPSNFGGRTRSLVIDKTDTTGNTIIAGGVSGGVFRTTDGGTTWTKVSSNDEIHNVTAIAQDPTNTKIWYYSTGEGLGNSASKSGSFYYGQGIWKSTNNGVNWRQISSTASTQESFDSVFDITFSLAVHPTTGELFAAVLGQILRFDSTTSSWVVEIDGSPSSSNHATDVVITTSGRVYAAFSGTTDPDAEGVWTSATGNGGWSRINTSSFTPTGRVVLALAPSNENKLYTLFVNGNSSDCSGNPQVEADLWLWNQSTLTYTNYTSKLPNESGCSTGNDPFAVQGGYDLVVNVKPDNENFVVIGGTNAYKIEDITTDAMFSRIGGYASSSGYAQYENHHSDIHVLKFSPFNTNILYSGTDGGVHVTSDITANTVAWTSLNNNYKTFQFYHIAISPSSGSDFVIGGAQDNGTKVGGTNIGASDATSHSSATGGDGVAVGIPNYSSCGISFFCGAQNGILYRYCDGYTNITPEDNTGTSYDSQFVTYFYVDPDNTNALYYAAENTLLRTTDGLNVETDTWTDLGNTNAVFGHSDEFQTFSTTRGPYNSATSYLLMGGDSGHIYRLNDPQNATSISSATDITPQFASTRYPSIVTGLAIHPTNNDIVLATYSNYGIDSIFLTTNATNETPTWTLVERNLSSHSIRSAAITQVSEQTLYFVGTARGLYSTLDPTTTDWERESPDEIGYALVSSLSYRPNDNHLLIGTHGNGMYEAIISKTLGTKKINDISNTISLYPNPTTTNINLKLPNNTKGSISYSIRNIMGQSVITGKLSNNKINVSDLTSGIYFIELKIDNKIATKKFIKK